MTPIHELLARIRWDPAFGRGRFEIAYLDHLQQALVRVPFERIEIRPPHQFGFETTSDDGTPYFVPYHRVREVWRDGVLIWSRHGAEPAR
ncbi:MAG: DUF504 domain-containing protein [Betaproteobacteria bacterium]|nr:MAG: DUF504 domain-containing protein [Betaproteobacteria bacterium]